MNENYSNENTLSVTLTSHHTCSPPDGGYYSKNYICILCIAWLAIVA